MEVKYNTKTNLLESKYFSINFPSISPTDVEELKINLMMDASYEFFEENSKYVFTNINGKVQLQIFNEGIIISCLFEQYSLFEQLDKLAELYVSDSSNDNTESIMEDNYTESEESEESEESGESDNEN